MSNAYLGSFHAPLVSVVVVSFNYGQFIEQCLRSIANQSYPYIECIVVDNASSDNTGDVIEAVTASGVFDVDGRSLSVIVAPRNLFQVGAAVEGFARSTGQFVIFFDADDVMLPACVEAHVRAMLSMRQPVGASCVDYFMASGDHIITSCSGSGFAHAMMSLPPADVGFRDVALPPISRGREISLSNSDVRLIGRTALGWPWSGTCGLCFRRELVALLFRRLPTMAAQLDVYLIGGINCLTGSIIIDRPLVIYRHHGGNVFAKGPGLNNFSFFDRPKLQTDMKEAQRQIIATFTAISPELGLFLDSPDIYIEAIQTLSKQWYGLEPDLPVGSFELSYLLKNEKILSGSFGKSRVATWISDAALRVPDDKSNQHEPCI